jgi:hypothetical protein
MKTLSATLTILAALSTSACGQQKKVEKRLSDALSAKEVYAKTADQVVTIECWNSNYIRTKQGSGIVLGRVSDKAGVDILTNYHVINSSSLIRITTKKGDTFNPAVLYFDAPTDVALLHVDRSDFQAATAQMAREVSVGDTVYAVGAPKGLGWTITSGIISGIRGDKGVKLIQTNASISPGSSGGALFNDSGELIGMTSFDIKEAQNLNFAVAVSHELLSSLRRFRDETEEKKPLPLPFANLPEDFWFIGHYEPGDDLSKRSNVALTKWLSYQPKWEALSRAQLEASSDAGSKEWKEFDLKIAKLLAERYAEFPYDRVGFLAHLDFVQDRQAKITELLAGAEKWPGEVDIIWSLYSTLSEDESLPLKVILAPLRAFVDALPSKSEVQKLAGYEFAPGVYRVAQAVERLQPILNLVDHTLRGIKEREETARIKTALVEKGWDMKRQ